MFVEPKFQINIMFSAQVSLKSHYTIQRYIWPHIFQTSMSVIERHSTYHALSLLQI